MAKLTKRNVHPAETNKPERGVFSLLDVDATDEEIEAFCRALGWTPEMGDAEEVTSAKAGLSHRPDRRDGSSGQTPVV